MEALAAISLAGNILQFTAFALNIISTANSLNKSTTESTKENLEISLVVSQLETLLENLVVSEDDPLSALVLQARNIGIELKQILVKVGRRGKVRYIAALRAAYVAEWRRDDIASIEKRLRRMTDTIAQEVLRREVSRLQDNMIETRQEVVTTRSEILAMNAETLEGFTKMDQNLQSLARCLAQFGGTKHVDTDTIKSLEEFRYMLVSVKDLIQEVLRQSQSIGMTITAAAPMQYNHGDLPAADFPPYRATELSRDSNITRERLFGRIEDHFRHHKATHQPIYVLLHGLPGSGKTQLSRAYAEAWTSGGHPAYWFDASSAETLDSDFSKFAMKAHLKSATELASIETIELREVVRDFFSSYGSANLLVFDNHDTVGESAVFSIAPYLPRTGFSRILITSRSAGADRALPTRDCQKLEISKLERDEAVRMFTQHVNMPEKDCEDVETRDLIARIACELAASLPLAIAEAAACIRNIGEDAPGKAELQLYIEDFSERQNGLHVYAHEYLAATYGRGVLEAFDMSFEQICRKNMIASKFLLFSSFFHHNGIKTDWIETAALNQDVFVKNGIDLNNSSLRWFTTLISINKRGTWNATPLKTSLKLLKDYALIEQEPDSNGQKWQIHPLIHQWAGVYSRNRSQNDYDEQARLAIAVLTESYDSRGDIEAVRAHEVALELYPHLDAWIQAVDSHSTLLKYSKTPLLSARSLLRLSNFLGKAEGSPRHKTLQTATRLKLLALANGAMLGGLVESSTLDALSATTAWISDNYTMRDGNLTALCDIYEELVEAAAVRSDALPWLGHDLAMNNLRRVLTLQGRDEQATVKAAEQALQYVENEGKRLSPALKIRHRAVLIALLADPDLRQSPRSMQEAIAKLEHLVQYAVRRMGQEHPDTLVACDRLAWMKFKQAKLRSEKNVLIENLIPLTNRRKRERRQMMLVMKTADTDMMSLAVLQVWAELRDIEAERSGRYHPETLRHECNRLGARPFLDTEGRIQRTRVSYDDRWRGREDTVAVPIEVALGYYTTAQAHNIQNLWEGVIEHTDLAAMSGKLPTLCFQALTEAAGAARAGHLEKHAESIEAIAKQINKAEAEQRDLSIEDRRKIFRRLRDLWNIMDILDEALTQSPGDTSMQESRLLEYLQQVQEGRTRQFMLFLLVKRLLAFAIMEKPTEEMGWSAMLTHDSLRSLEQHVSEAFGFEGAVYQIWSIVLALNLHLLGLRDEAKGPETHLLRRTEIERKRIFPQRPPLNLEYFHSLPVPSEGLSVEEIRNERAHLYWNHAEFSLRVLQMEYLRRNLLPFNQMRITDELMEIEGRVYGWGSSDVVKRLVSLAQPLLGGSSPDALWPNLRTSLESLRDRALQQDALALPNQEIQLRGKPAASLSQDDDPVLMNVVIERHSEARRLIRGLCEVTTVKLAEMKVWRGANIMLNWVLDWLRDWAGANAWVSSNEILLMRYNIALQKSRNCKMQGAKSDVSGSKVEMARIEKLVLSIHGVMTVEEKAEWHKLRVTGEAD